MTSPPRNGFRNEHGLCVVTGGNRGIGKEVAGGLMGEGRHVILACRNMQTCREAKADLDGRKLPGSCECRELDLMSPCSIKGFARSVVTEALGNGRTLDVLVNNAGVMGLEPRADPLEDGHMFPNHLGPFLLTNLLLEAMPAGGRVVNVASRAHRQGSLQIGTDERGGSTIAGTPASWYHSYARSKLCNILHIAELQRRLDEKGRGITAYSISPGLTNSGIFRNVAMPPPLRWVFEPIARALYRTPEQAAATVLLAATSPDLEGKHVLYLADLRPATPSAAARDAELAKGLWEASELLLADHL